MQRAIYLAYGLASYLLFLLAFAYFMAFAGNLLVPKSIDSGAQGRIATAIAIDLLLIVAFAVQHSVMARPAFKRWWTRYVPQPIERSTYMLASSLVLMLLIWQWRPIQIVVWDAPQGIARSVLWMLFFAGWLMVPAVSLLISHFDLFGLRQVWHHWRGIDAPPLPFRTPGLYAVVRHPLYIGWAIAFWATPTMTVGHLLFAAGMTAYMVVATLFEERDLVAHFGEQYEEYRRRVPMFVPRVMRS